MQKNFDVFVPIDKVSTLKKSESGTDHAGNYLVQGYASTGDPDLQGETIDPAGLDDSYLVENGWIDFEHDTDQVIGVPTANTHVDQNGLYLEAELFKNMPQVQDIIKLYHNIKDNDINRNLGFSVEGNVIERDAEDESIIRQVQITGVAVTKNPANTHATWELVSKSIFSPNKHMALDSDKTMNQDPMLSMTVKINKSKADSKDVNKALTAGHGISPSIQANGAAFRTEQFSDTLVNIADNMRQARQIGLESVAPSVAEILDGRDADDETLTIFLQLFTGISATDAQGIIQALQTKNLTTQRLQNLLGGSDDITSDADDDD